MADAACAAIGCHPIRIAAVKQRTVVRDCVFCAACTENTQFYAKKDNLVKSATPESGAVV